MQLAHIATGSKTASGCVNSRGTLRAIAGNVSPCRQAITPSKPRGGATTCVGSGDSGEGESHSASSACDCFSALWLQALLASELWWQCLCFDSPRASGVCPMAVTGREGCNTYSQLGNWFGGASIFTCFSCGTWDVMDSSRDPPMGATSSMVTSLDGTLVEVGGVSRKTEV